MIICSFSYMITQYIQNTSVGRILVFPFLIVAKNIDWLFSDLKHMAQASVSDNRHTHISEIELLEGMIYELADHHIIDSALEDRFMNAIAGEWFAPVFQNKSPEDLYWISILLNTIAKYRQVSSDLTVLDRLMDDYADRIMDDNDQQLLAEYHAISDSMESLREYCRNPSAHLLE